MEPKTTWKSEIMSALGMAVTFAPVVIGWLAGHVSEASIWAPVVACAGIVMNYVHARQATKQAVIAAQGQSLQVAYDPAKDPNKK